MADRRQADERHFLPAGGRDLPEAFGTGRPDPPGYEAFGRAEHVEAAPSREKSPGRPRDDAPHPQNEAPEENRSEEGSEENRGEPRERKPAEDEADKKPPLYKRPVFLISAGVVVVVAGVIALIWWLHARQYVSTDDAFIDSHVTTIAPQVSGLVKLLHVDDNQFVHKGDVLVELDPTDFQIALDQAEASVAAAEGKLAQAKAQVTQAVAGVAQVQAEVDAAQVNLDNSTRDLRRYQNIDERARSQQQLDNAEAAQKNAAAQLAQARAKQSSAEAAVVTARAAVEAANGDLERARADAHHNAINLGYTKIIAPSDGRVTLRTIEPGAYVAAGQTLFSLVSPDVWVVANFKETQLTLMRPGQSVTIKVDAFPDKKYEGTVDSFQAGSGSRFSVLPAENATGNFVKVVQRVPVKILFNHSSNEADAPLLSPGLSVTPKVKVR
jgi:membrane fusion protein (multidrug efflux system)